MIFVRFDLLIAKSRRTCKIIKNVKSFAGERPSRAFRMSTVGRGARMYHDIGALLAVCSSGQRNFPWKRALNHYACASSGTALIVGGSCSGRGSPVRQLRIAQRVDENGPFRTANAPNCWRSRFQERTLTDISNIETGPNSPAERVRCPSVLNQ